MVYFPSKVTGIDNLFNRTLRGGWFCKIDWLKEKAQKNMFFSYLFSFIEHRSTPKQASYVFIRLDFPSVFITAKTCYIFWSSSSREELQ